MSETGHISRLVSAIIKHPWKIMLTALLIAIGVSSQVVHLKPDFGYRIWFNEKSKDLAVYDEFEARFGSDETAVIAVHSESGVFDIETATLLQNLTEDMWMAPDVIRVDSLSNFNWTHASGDDIEVEPLIPDDIELTEEILNKRKKIALSHNSVINYLISKDGKTAVVYARLKPFLKGTPDYEKVVKGLRKVISKYHKTGDHNIYLTGGPAVSYSFKEAAQRDLMFLVPIVIGVVIIFLMGTLKRISGVALSLFMIFITIFVTLGFGGLVGLPFNNLTSMTPQFMIAICIAVVVHLLVSYFQFLDKGLERKEALRQALIKNLRPTLLTSLSTAFGFFSFCTTGIPAFITMGLMAGTGTILTWFSAYFILAPLLSIIPVRSRGQKKISSKEEAFGPSQRSIKFTEFLFINRKKIIFGGALVALLSIGLSSQVQVNSDPFEYFDKRTKISIANHFLEDHVGGSQGGEIIINSGEKEGIKDPGFLNRVLKFQNWIDEYPFVTKTVSIIDILKDTNKSLNGGDQAYYVLPKERNMIAQQLFLYSMSLPQGMDLNDRMTIENDSLRLTAMWNVHDSATILRVAEEIEAKGKELGLSVKVSGKSVLWQTITKPIITSFIKSLLLAIFLISILLIFGLRSIKIGLFALIPNALPLIFGGALLVILGKYLDIGTVIVGAITLGIAVDDTIHFLSSYMRFLNEGFNAKEAISRIFSLTVPALSVTTLVLAVSFGTFIFGDFVPNQNFGIMVALILTFALVADVLFLPALLMIVGEDFFVSKKKSNFQYEKPDGLVI